MGILLGGVIFVGHRGRSGSIYSGFVCCENSRLIKSVNDGPFSGVFFVRDVLMSETEKISLWAIGKLVFLMSSLLLNCDIFTPYL